MPTYQSPGMARVFRITRMTPVSRQRIIEQFSLMTTTTDYITVEIEHPNGVYIVFAPAWSIEVLPPEPPSVPATGPVGPHIRVRINGGWAYTVGDYPAIASDFVASAEGSKFVVQKKAADGTHGTSDYWRMILLESSDPGSAKFCEAADPSNYQKFSDVGSYIDAWTDSTGAHIESAQPYDDSTNDDLIAMIDTLRVPRHIP
ncbi:MAG: hypothetical protein ACREJC_02800 [Tepidisphaeraceae bacterium]